MRAWLEAFAGGLMMWVFVLMLLWIGWMAGLN